MLILKRASKSRPSGQWSDREGKEARYRALQIADILPLAEPLCVNETAS